MIDRLHVTNFQSLAEADIELGGLTVIVGPSNSGKSAVLRALKAVVRNVGSPSAVRVGQSLFTSSVIFDGTTVALERGKSASTYKVIAADGSEDVFAKAGRTVPEEVQRLIGLPDPDGPDLVFSSQIDPPFLLSETGSTAAKMLGDLTNVSRLHAAAKEANRRRLESSKVHKIRTEDARGCFDKLQTEFADLPIKKKALVEARETLDGVQADARLIERVNGLLESLSTAEAAETTIRKHIETLPEPADIEEQAEQAGSLLGQAHSLSDVVTALARLGVAEAELSTLR